MSNHTYSYQNWIPHLFVSSVHCGLTIDFDSTCVSVKEETANPEVESVAIWNSFYY